MFKRRHIDGSPLTSSEQSSVIDSNESALSRINSQMKSASVAYKNDNSVLAKLDSVSASHSNDQFTLADNDFDELFNSKAEIFKADKSEAISKAPSLSSAYDSISEDNSAMWNGTLGEQVASSENAKQARQSSQMVQVRLQSDPQFSMSYSASVSASASFADLPQSKQTSLLNSYAEAERHRKTDSMFGYQGQNLPTGTLNAMRNGTYNEANRKRRRNRKNNRGNK